MRERERERVGTLRGLLLYPLFPPVIYRLEVNEIYRDLNTLVIEQGNALGW